MSFESAATRYICQMRSTPAVNLTRHVESVTCAWYRYTMSLTSHLHFYKNPGAIILVVKSAKKQTNISFHVLNYLLMNGGFTINNFGSLTLQAVHWQNRRLCRWPSGKASASRAVDSDLIPSRVKPITLILIFTASLLDPQH